jgi:hypothetical protein
MPSVYELLPAPPDLYPGARPYPTNWDLYDAAEWRIEGIRQDLLDNAHRFHGWLATADPQVEMVEIAGCHMETTVEIRRSFGPDERPAFEAIRVESGPDSGDSTVPLWSTRLPGAKMYFTQNLHRYLPKRKGLIDDVLTLVQGGEPDLPTEIPEPRSGLFAEGKAVPVEERAERLREGLQSGSLRESDLAALAEGF